MEKRIHTLDTHTYTVTAKKERLQTSDAKIYICTQIMYTTAIHTYKGDAIMKTAHCGFPHFHRNQLNEECTLQILTLLQVQIE